MPVGADLIFTEALSGAAEFEKFRSVVSTPRANGTEFGTSALIPAALESIGHNAVICPVPNPQPAMSAAETGLREIHAGGARTGLPDRRQPRCRLSMPCRAAAVICSRAVAEKDRPVLIRATANSTPLSMISPTLIARLPETCHPMGVVRTAVGCLGAGGPAEDEDPKAVRAAVARSAASRVHMFAVAHMLS
ncbi:hypothetical protein ACFYTF_25985 [Nocardia thailandica]|uniref:Uncharacterized protein n=1 Tax=Nocardia thailandica TaxID=257275 RepID=A0ABW6PV62_9NOCA